MVLGFGCVHPPGERESDYDGLYFREDEMSGLAEKIIGKPLCIEHDLQEPVGKVINAWVGRDKALNVIFETDSTFKGFLAENLIVRDMCKDLSLGHDVKIDRSNMRVLDKLPTEVSICVKGDRQGTHIRTVGKEKNSCTFDNDDQQLIEYIKGAVDKQVPQTSTMSSEDPKTQKPKEAADEEKNDQKKAATPPEQKRNENLNELLDLVTKQQGELTAMKTRFEEQQQRAKNAEDKVNAYAAKGKRKRSALIDDSVKKLVQHLLKSEEFREQLKPQEEQIDAIMEGLKDSEEAAPLVDVVACAASALTRSTTKLEAEYQATKRLKTENEELKQQIATYQKPALESARERFGGAKKAPPQAPASAPQWSQVARMPRGMKPMQAPKTGMQVQNPEFWKELVGRSRQSNTTGMGWFDESNLVGKQYEAGQRPKPIA